MFAKHVPRKGMRVRIPCLPLMTMDSLAIKDELKKVVDFDEIIFRKDILKVLYLSLCFNAKYRIIDTGHSELVFVKFVGVN